MGYCELVGDNEQSGRWSRKYKSGDEEGREDVEQVEGVEGNSGGGDAGRASKRDEM